MKKGITLTIAVLMLNLSAFAQKDTIKAREVGLVFSNLNSFGLCYKFGNENTLFRITALSSTGANSKSTYNTYTYNGINDTVAASPTSSFAAGLNFGFEKRKKWNERFYFYYGLILINSYSESKSTTVTPTNYGNIGYFNSNNEYIVQSAFLNAIAVSNVTTISSGLGLVLGVAYKFGSSFSIGAELTPSILYNYSETNASSTTYGISWQSKGSGLGYTLNSSPVIANSDKITKGISYSVINTGAAITIAYRIK